MMEAHFLEKYINDLTKSPFFDIITTVPQGRPIFMLIS